MAVGLTFLYPRKFRCLLKKIATMAALKSFLDHQRKNKKTIGFVPTMGALHQGHLSLLERAGIENDLVVCSIFVNPTQFNDPKDLEKYPRPFLHDIAKLESLKCDVLFNPQVTEMYTQNEHWEIDLDGLDTVLEGLHRPGHFAGVTQIVYKLLHAAGPCTAYFGQKDFQQFRIVQYMVDKLNMPYTLVRCPIFREPDGLAMSSRNIYLNENERQNALTLSKSLVWLSDHLMENDVMQKARNMLTGNKGLVLDYLELIDGETLQTILPREMGSTDHEVVAVVAAKAGNTRLIDNCIVKALEHPVSIS